MKKPTTVTGLGDLVAPAATAIAIKLKMKCIDLDLGAPRADSVCERRRAWLNKRFPMPGRRKSGTKQSK